MFQTKVVQKIKTHILFPKTSPTTPKGISAVYDMMCKNEEMLIAM
jgi:hypothetical protein